MCGITDGNGVSKLQGCWEMGLLVFRDVTEGCEC